MPSTLLFATNHEGRVYTLSTNSSAWREFPYFGLEFKKISAIPNFIWAIGGDRQLYVHVYGLDIPIRIKEEVYENERWLPIEGFSKKLLPTDRPHYSSADGTLQRNVHNIRLPSMAWQWEGDWHLDLELNGQPLAEDGWMYALDFSTSYSNKKSWNSYVRRRHWIRYKRYCAMDSWCAVAPLYKDPTKEPFIDVAIGGTNIPNAPSGTQVVWAITAHGNAMFRWNVSSTSPEGRRWKSIFTPRGNELTQLSVGPTGLVWAVLSNGCAIVRTGVTRDCLSGESWLDVKPPVSNLNDKASDQNLSIVQLSVGTNSVWCVTNDNSVWFRRGIKGELAGVNEDAAIGSGWVEMAGNISMVSVTSNDQVFGIGSSDRSLFYRFGVTNTDSTGKKWQHIQLPKQISRTSSSMSIVSRQSTGSNSTPGSKHQSFSNLYNKEKEKGVIETCATIENVPPSSNSSYSSNSGDRLQLCGRNRNELWKNSSDSTAPSNACSLNLSERHRNRNNINILRANVQSSSAPVADVAAVSEITGRSYETQLKNPRAWSPVRSIGSVVGMEAHPESDFSAFDAKSTYHGSDVFIGDDDDHTGSQFWTEFDIIWSSIAAGAVYVDSSNLPNWFKDSQTVDNRIDLKALWRQDILAKLTSYQNKLQSIPNIDKYEKAVELSSWIKSIEAHYQNPNTLEYEDCRIELEWVNSNGHLSESCSSTPTNDRSHHSHLDLNQNQNDSGTFTVLHPDGITTKIQFSLSAITCVQCCSEPGLPRIAIHVLRLFNNLSPVRLQFASDVEMEDWLSHLTSVCCQINEVAGKPDGNSVWATTELAEVFVFDPCMLKAQQWDEKDKCYTQKMDTNTLETPYTKPLNNGMPIGSELEINGSVYDDADQIRFDLQSYPKIKVRMKIDKYRMIAMHINPRFNENAVIFNTMYNSEWLEEIRYNQMSFTPGSTFKLVIKAAEKDYKIYINGSHFTDYQYRIDPDSVSCLYVSGRVKLCNVTYRCPTVIIPMEAIFWRQMGGHVKRIFTCSVPKLKSDTTSIDVTTNDNNFSAIVWGITCDNTVWVYTGGWGGNFLRDLDGASGKINSMVDTHVYHIYENQRWNPISGFTTKSLPTDRYIWSDITGRQKRSKDRTKLLSSHYEWISDWMIDYNIKGGTDKEGWQYAIDFAASYHAHKRITDYVRRRRWIKKCRLMCSGPWQELSQTKILDVALCNQNSIKNNKKDDDDVNSLQENYQQISVWAITTNGEVLLRHGVTVSNPRGDNWEHVSSDQALISIDISPKGDVWVVGRNGVIFYRQGISKENPIGEKWQTIEAPHGIRFKSVSVGSAGVWAIDSINRLAIRKNCNDSQPEGTEWEFLPNVESLPLYSETQVGFRCVSVGSEVWAVAMNGVICKRCGITKENPSGAGWSVGIAGQWQHVSVTDFREGFANIYV